MGGVWGGGARLDSHGELGGGVWGGWADVPSSWVSLLVVAALQCRCNSCVYTIYVIVFRILTRLYIYFVFFCNQAGERSRKFKAILSEQKFVENFTAAAEL